MEDSWIAWSVPQVPHAEGRQVKATDTLSFVARCPEREFVAVSFHALTVRSAYLNAEPLRISDVAVVEGLVCQTCSNCGCTAGRVARYY